MKPTSFARYLTDFLSVYLSGQKNASKNTIYAYRDTFKLLLTYCQQVEGIAIERINLEVLTAGLITGFLSWLETDRKCCIATRNQRLAVIHSFFRYMQSEAPAGIYHFQQVISIPRKKAQTKTTEFLSVGAVKLILEQPNKNTIRGRRDLTLLSVLYDTGARVQELIDLKVENIILSEIPVVLLTGKGNKTRRVPLMKNTSALLERYFQDNRLDKDWKKQYPLFVNSQNNKLTKEGVAYILDKYVEIAKAKTPTFSKKISPHILRHSKAMHLLQAGVNLIYIRDFLGHVDIKTTEIYARTDTEVKRKAIEKACPDVIDADLPEWTKNKELLAWLSELK